MKFLLDMFFPKVCVECGEKGYDICENCFGKISIRKHQQCPHCKKANSTGDFCNKRCKEGYNFDRLIVCAEYGQIKKLLIRFKYKFAKEIIKNLRKLLEAELKNYTNFRRYGDIIIPTPIHKRNYKKRGFNQSLLLAEAVTKIFPNIKLIDCLVEREKREQQAHLDRKHRLENLKNSIVVKNKTLPKNILLIDDIVTTGSTLNECGKVLKKAGVKEITAIALAGN